MNTFYKVSLIAFSIIITALCFIVYKQHKEIEEIKNQTSKIEKKIDINPFSRGFNNSFNQNIGDKVLELESEIEDLKQN